MSKKNFAKKFVAYTMAFAVAFATVNVSPIFVKDAQAAPAEPLDVTVDFSDVTMTASGVVGDNDNVLSAGDIILGKVTTSCATADVTGTYAKDTIDSKVLASKADLLGSVMTGLRVVTDTTSGSAVYKIKGDAAAYTLGAKDVSGSNAIASTDVDFVFNDLVYCDGVSPEHADHIATGVKCSTKGNVNYLKDFGTGKFSFFKLEPKTATFNNSYKVGEEVKTETITVEYFMVVAKDSVYRKQDGEMNKFECAKVEEDDLGLYLSAKYVNDSLDTAADYTLFEINEVSELTASSIEKNQAEVFSTVGGNAVLEAVAKNTSTTRNLTWKWSLYGEPVSSKDGKVELSNLKKEDFGRYYFTVTDGIATETGYVDLTEATASMADAVKSANKAIASFAKVLNVDDNDTAGNTADDTYTLNQTKATLTSAIPENNEFVYIWAYDTSVLPVTYEAKMEHNATNKTVTMFSADTYNASQLKDVICYAVPKTEYNEVLKADLAGVTNATDEVAKAQAIDTLRTDEILAVTTGDLKDKIAYTETIKLVDINSKDTAEIVMLQPGKALSLNVTGDVEDTYAWTKPSTFTGDLADYTTSCGVNTASANEIGVYTCVRTDKDATGATIGTSTHLFNVIYVSDLTATAKNVTAKLGDKNVEIVVDANATLPIRYTWGNPVGLAGTAKEASATNKTKITEVKGFTDFVADTDPATGKLTNNYIPVKVEDGLSEIDLQIAIEEITTFTVAEYGKLPAAVGATLAPVKPATTTKDIPSSVYGEKGTSVTLEPQITVSEGTTLTYKWTRGTTVLGTDAKLTIPSFADGTVVLTVTSSDNKVITVTYTLNELDKAAITVDNVDIIDYEVKDAMTYTGEELNPVTKVIFTDKTGTTENGVYTLVEGTDYEVVLEENINVGTARYTIKPLGKFAKVDGAGALVAQFAAPKTGKGTFFIDRANNEVEIANVDVKVGESVQPATVKNLANATLTYKYYSDASATTEIAVPTTEGTYYVVANADATANYNAAKSNVATVKISAADKEDEKPEDDDFVLGKTASIKAATTKSTSIKLAWEAVEGADAYRVYVYLNGAYKVLADDLDALTFTAKDLTAGKKYVFAVKAFKDGKAAATFTKATLQTAPGVTSAIKVGRGYTSLKLTWNKVTGATGYRVYVAQDGNWVQVKKATTANTFTKTGLKSGKSYKFAVRAYRSENGKVVWADTYKSVTAKTVAK